MAQGVKPQPQFIFGGINLSGSVLDRPYGSAATCENFRVMPGGWLRIRGGRRVRVNGTSIVDVKAMHRVELAGTSAHLTCLRYSGPTVKICKLTVPATLDEAGLETLSSGLDGNINVGYRHPMCTLPDSVIWYNGKGYRVIDDPGSLLTSGDAAANPVSVPPLTQWKSSWGGPQYFGLYPLKKAAVTPPALSVSWAGGAGYNRIASSVSIYVGLHNISTNHYSNGVLAATMTTQSGFGTLTVDGLANLQVPWLSTYERDNLRFVYYATIDGYNVPYLILNGDVPLMTTYNGATSQSLSLESDPDVDNGWILDTTHEMPTLNFPPRPTRCIWFVGERLYSIPSDSHSALASAVDATYSATAENGVEYDYTERELAGVAWSGAEGAVRKIDFLGDPLQSWDPRNFQATPTGEKALWGMDAPDNITSVVWTGTRTHLLREQENNVHEWEAASQFHGLSKHENGPRTIQKTQHGIVWLTQFNQLALMDGDLKVSVISREYDAILQGATPRCGLYVYDPINEIDRYMLFYTDSDNIERALCHDFKTGAYLTREPHRVTFAARLQSSTGEEYHFVAGGSAADNNPGFYSIEGQPDASYRVPARDELFNNGATSASAAVAIPDAYYGANWSAFGDASNRKEILQLDIIGDNATSSSLAARPLTIEWFKGFGTTVAAGSGTQLSLIDPTLYQEPSDMTYSFGIADRHHFWWKFLIRLRPHHGDLVTIYYPPSALDGNFATSVYGPIFYSSILGLMFHLSTTANRRS